MYIKTKDDLREFLTEDQKAYHKTKERGFKKFVCRILFRDRFWDYIVCLRKYEYWLNSRGGGFQYWYAYKLGKLKQKTGIDLEPNCVEKGIHIPHGKIVVNPNARIGEHCKIMSDVTIGAQGNHTEFGTPKIGNRVYIGSGAKIIGEVEIADGIVIGANSVVNKSFLEPGITIAGIPARKISNTDSYDFVD